MAHLNVHEIKVIVFAKPFASLAVPGPYSDSLQPSVFTLYDNLYYYYGNHALFSKHRNALGHHTATSPFIERSSWRSSLLYTAFPHTNDNYNSAHHGHVNCTVGTHTVG
jgi:hypothetical protein